MDGPVILKKKSCNWRGKSKSIYPFKFAFQNPKSRKLRVILRKPAKILKKQKRNLQPKLPPSPTRIPAILTKKRNTQIKKKHISFMSISFKE